MLAVRLSLTPLYAVITNALAARGRRIVRTLRSPMDLRSLTASSLMALVISVDPITQRIAVQMNTVFSQGDLAHPAYAVDASLT